MQHEKEELGRVKPRGSCESCANLPERIDDFPNHVCVHQIDAYPESGCNTACSVSFGVDAHCLSPPLRARSVTHQLPLRDQVFLLSCTSHGNIYGCSYCSEAVLSNFCLLCLPSLSSTRDYRLSSLWHAKDKPGFKRAAMWMATLTLTITAFSR